MFMAYAFMACENEPLTGHFPDGPGQGGAGQGQFRASVAGQEFIADLTSATLSESNTLEISGLKAFGEKITLSVENAEVGTFSLDWDGMGSNFGKYNDRTPGSLPYMSLGGGGGSGELIITELDSVANKVSGTFRFTGIRIKMDDTGNPILDGNGMPVIEQMQITEGVFNSIAYELGEGDGSGDGDGDNPPPNEFFARVDGVDFIPDSLWVSEPINADVPMLKIEAMAATHELIRIDIPKSLGVGTFDMVNLSDGTKLIGVYKDNRGGANLTSNPGTITISEFDLVTGVLKATFQFDANDPLGEDPAEVRVRRGEMTIYFEGVPGASNSFAALVDDVSYTPETVQIERSVVNQYPRVTLITQYEDQRMELSFPATITVGIFEMEMEVVDGNEVVGTYYPVDGVSIPYFSESGSIEITSYDYVTGIVEGTFSFTAVDASGMEPTVYEITEGEFLAILP